VGIWGFFWALLKEGVAEQLEENCIGNEINMFEISISEHKSTPEISQNWDILKPILDAYHQA